MLTHVKSVELKAGKAVLVINTGVDLGKDKNEIDYVIYTFRQLCVTLSTNYRLAPLNCWQRYQVLRSAAQRVKCLIDSFHHVAKPKRNKRSLTPKLEEIIASVANHPQREKSFLDERQPESLPLKSAAGVILDTLYQKKAKQDVEEDEVRFKRLIQDQLYENISCPYNPSLKRNARKGDLTWLFSFLFAGDDDKSPDHDELKYHEYQTNIQLASVKENVKQNAANAELFRSAYEQLMEGLARVSANQLSYNHNEMNLLLASQTLNVMQTLDDLQVQYLSWENPASLLMSLDQARADFQNNLPSGLSLSKSTNEELLKVADRHAEVANNSVIIKVNIPIVYDRAYEAMRITPIPDMKSEENISYSRGIHRH